MRDIVLQHLEKDDRRLTDFDFTTDARPEEIQALFPESFYENSFGTVSVTDEHLREQIGLPHHKIEEHDSRSHHPLITSERIKKVHPSLKQTLPSHHGPAQPNELVQSNIKPYEITTFRSDGAYTNHRKPESVSWGTSLEEDLERRDFTMNAMAIEIPQTIVTKKIATTEDLTTLTEQEYTLHDPHHGWQDLQKRRIRTVGDPNRRFEEDALRMLRAIRFSVQLNIQILDETFESIISHSDQLTFVSAERIRDEFLKIIASNFPKEGIILLDESNLLKHILPELLAAKGVEQGGHHTTDVWTHLLDALAECPSPDPIVRLATLLHDIAKPDTYAQRAGSITFYSHEVIGARTAKRIATRLRLSRQDTDRLFILVRYHMFHYQPDQSDAAIRRFMRKVGMENLNDILDLREGDRLGSGARKTSWRLEEMKERMIQQLDQPFSITDLHITGTDLMTELKLKPGKIIGETLQHLLELVLENPEHNSRDTLLKQAEKFLKSKN